MRFLFNLFCKNHLYDSWLNKFFIDARKCILTYCLTASDSIFCSMSGNTVGLFWVLSCGTTALIGETNLSFVSQPTFSFVNILIPSCVKTWFTFNWIMAFWVRLWIRLYSQKANLWVLDKCHVFLFNYLKIYNAGRLSDSCERICAFKNPLAGFCKSLLWFQALCSPCAKDWINFQTLYYGLMGESLVDEFNRPKC